MEKLAKDLREFDLFVVMNDVYEISKKKNIDTKVEITTKCGKTFNLNTTDEVCSI
jgi:hypothetical protein